ncbi:MAG: hypothetical protein ACI3XJ_12175 [Oscillospiraceae bacterium]
MMILHEIVRALERVEERQREILERLDQSREGKAREDEWLQSGIDNIMAFQAGKRKEE